ncbi:amino-acid N-acetyltransferase [Congregibacter litoralis]|uniref:Amino-acid acetyltransferase n=1 Tax=Congregibacter litoralis KT71 TaxID=314285 RepID=A4A8Z2_9GAMM|nr:amino-acid N-acetyltransferase [Congregibacter litoralis]EAQ97534.1 N-acetylglutamate synthase [Congregibacter litoralis KT71]
MTDSINSHSSPSSPISWFRNTAPYINRHRGSTFVIVIPGAVQESGALPRILHDLALLSSLGVRLVLVFGSRPQIDRRLKERGIETRLHRGQRITDTDTLPHVLQVVGAQRIELEALLSLSLPNSPMQDAKLRAVSGNFVMAQPLGVVDGVDHHLTGRVRRVDTDGIQSLLQNGSLVLLSSVGYSPTGEAFNLSLGDVAISTARDLSADKLIILGSTAGVHDSDGALIKQIAVDQQSVAAPDHEEEARLLHIACDACRAGVPRSHIVSFQDPDALLGELFTTDGSGTLVARRPYEQSRWASIRDVGGVLDLITPLEASGVLLKRSRDLLEAEIGRFRILERDGRTIACAALYPFEERKSAELACIVAHPDYRGEQRARRLLQELEHEALAQGLREVFVLTTQTAHWFLEQGFEEGSLEKLPPTRKALYNLQRNSKVFFKTLAQNS